MKANIIIHGFATAAAATSGLTSMIPFIGPLAGDTIGLTAITIAMTVSLASLFDKKFETGALASFGAVVGGMMFGAALGKGIISLVPGLGAGANAIATFALHEATGWALFLIFERGGDLPKSKGELQAAIKEGEDKAKKEKEAYERMLSKLPPDKRDEVEQLQKKMADKSLSEAEKRVISDKIVAIFEQYADK
jgi:uncharacterized protein (DUF697 family)